MYDFKVVFAVPPCASRGNVAKEVGSRVCGIWVMN